MNGLIQQLALTTGLTLHRLMGIALLACLSTSTSTSTAQAVELNCDAHSRISESFDNGARWDLCWESRIRENLVLSEVHYTPPGGEPLRVLSSARLSQLHVAYDDSDVTYNDVTQYGLGGGYLQTLSAADCPLGNLLNVQTRPAICRWRNQGDAAYRTANRAATTQSLNLFSVSQVGAYAYIINWTFHDDGAVEPGVGATGALQRSSSDTKLPFGRLLQGDPDTLWLSHTHNYYWRLDFDLGSAANDDRFSETRYVPQSDGTRIRQTRRFRTEQALSIQPEMQQRWQISASDGEDSPAYLIEPTHLGHRFVRTDVEPYSEYDLFVTVASDCERFASQNARFNPDCLNDVLQYVDGQSIVDEDIVLWHRVGFHHMPRSEDQRHMHAHWDGFVMQAQNVLPGTSGLSGLPNQAPVWQQLIDRDGETGADIHTQLQADDADNDILSYSATGLPPGVSLSTRGHLHGRLQQAGLYTVEVVVRDDHSHAVESFKWTVGEVAPVTRKGGGAASVLLLLSAGVLLAWRRPATGIMHPGS
ncbi:MAG: hypothetical protein HKN42_17435 [Granulosicoccus sp.]|nr:hypothetical protein [Granulosicoccus sp.]